MNNEELFDKGWMDSQEVRVEFEHEGGELRRVTGEDAELLMSWFSACESVMHTRSYGQEFPELQWEVEEQ